MTNFHTCTVCGVDLLSAMILIPNRQLIKLTGYVVRYT
jgi:hypothetical protein